MAGRYTLDSSGADRRFRNVALRDAFIRKIAQEMKADAILSMQQSPASGKAYQRGQKLHIASSAGSPPRIDFGTLVNSIDVAKVKAMMYLIGTHVLHGRRTEFGIGMAPRPWLRPAFARAKDRIQAMNKDNVV